MLARAAAALSEVDKRIRTLVTLAHAVTCDETPIRVGPRKVKRYLLVACTSLYTWYLLGDRSLATFKAFVLAELRGIVVHDRYQNYDSASVGTLVHQLCAQHLLRDLDDAAESYPTAHWPTQIADALRELIHAANTARDAGLPAVPTAIADPLIRLFRHGVRVGLSDVRRTPGAKPNSHRAGRCWRCCATASRTCCASSTTCRSLPPQTRQSGTCGPRRRNRRSPDASSPRIRPGTATASPDTPRQQPNTASTNSSRSAMRCSARPGHRRSPRPLDPTPPLETPPADTSHHTAQREDLNAYAGRLREHTSESPAHRVPDRRTPGLQPRCG
jgi:hypothetical protein